MSGSGLISPRQRRIEQGLKEGPHLPEDLRAAFDSARQKISAIIQGIDATKIKVANSNDLYKLSVSLSALIKAQTEAERWSCERLGLLQEAVGKVYEEQRLLLAGKPELCNQIREVVEEAGKRLQGGIGASE